MTIKATATACRRAVQAFLVIAGLLISFASARNWIAVRDLPKGAGYVFAFSSSGGFYDVVAWTAQHPPRFLVGLWIVIAWLLMILSLFRVRLAGFLALPLMAGLFWLAFLGNPVAWPWRAPLPGLGSERVVPSTGYWLAVASVLAAGLAAIAGLAGRPDRAATA